MSPLLTYVLLSLLILAACAYALWKGGPAERWGAAIILALVVLERTSRYLLPQFAPILGLCGDALSALGLLVVALRFASPWLGGIMLFYAAQFTLHSVYLVTDRSSQEPLHIIINDINFAGILVCLVVGTSLSWRRRLRARREPA